MKTVCYRWLEFTQSNRSINPYYLFQIANQSSSTRVSNTVDNRQIYRHTKNYKSPGLISHCIIAQLRCSSNSDEKRLKDHSKSFLNTNLWITKIY
jgi:hypothetical protein